MFTDAGLGDENIRMIKLCQSVGAGAKFTGSGGAVVACCPDGAEQEARLKATVTKAGFSMPKSNLLRVNSKRCTVRSSLTLAVLVYLFYCTCKIISCIQNYIVSIRYISSN